ncbi:MAG: Holliday junction resolvase RuvX [Selenomonadales bacterium]|nr:Holliday junction resolvase RuvX [Selenomonadales bacterium]
MQARRILGLDVGEKKIGVAVSDPLGLTAQGLETILRRSLAQDVRQIVELVAHWQVGLIVVGLPISLNNTAGPQAEKVKSFAAALAAKTPVPLSFVDERFSTRIATQTLLLADTSRQKRKQVVDRLAAQLILQAYLDRAENRKDPI